MTSKEFAVKAEEFYGFAIELLETKGVVPGSMLHAGLISLTYDIPRIINAIKTDSK